MTEELKFLQQIVKAYDRKDSASSLTAFFRQVDPLKINHQFTLFMKECLAYRDSLEKLGVLQEFLSIDDYQNLGKYGPQKVNHTLQSLLDDIVTEIGYPAKTEEIEIRIFFNHALHCQVVFSHDSNFHVIKNILPGLYIIKLSTGRIIWEKHLTSRHVLLKPPAEQRELKLAAQTGPDRRAATLEDVIMGKIRMRVFAGTNGGVMEIKRS